MNDINFFITMAIANGVLAIGLMIYSNRIAKENFKLKMENSDLMLLAQIMELEIIKLKKENNVS